MRKLCLVEVHISPWTVKRALPVAIPSVMDVPSGKVQQLLQQIEQESGGEHTDIYLTWQLSVGPQIVVALHQGPQWKL